MDLNRFKSVSGLSAWLARPENAGKTADDYIAALVVSSNDIPILRSGSSAPVNSEGKPGDWYLRS